jgi:MFS family permease
MLPSGRLSDIVGRRRSYLTALTAFSLASAGICAAPDIWVMMGFQVAQAAAVAAVWANSVALLFDSLIGHQFRMALGCYIAAISIADLAGPTIGGILTQALGWRWIFGISAAIGVGCVGWSARALPRRAGRATRARLDGVGVVLLIAGLSGLAGGLLGIQASGSVDITTAAASVVGAGLLIVFVRVEARRRNPLIDIGQFSAPRLRFAMCSGFLNAAAQWVPSLLLVLYFQAHDGDTASTAGVLIMPLPIAATVSSLAMGRLSRRVRTDRLTLLGSAAGMIGLAGVAATLGAPRPLLLVALALLGCGTGVFSPAFTDVVMHETKSTDAGSVNGARLTIQNLGWVITTPLILGLATGRLTASQRHSYFAGELHSVSRHAAHLLFLGYDLAFCALAIIAAAATVLCYAVLRSPAPTNHESADVREPADGSRCRP